MYSKRSGFIRRSNSTRLTRHGATQYVRDLNSSNVPPYMITQDKIPEAKRILEEGNNHSMEFEESTFNATWSKDQNGIPQFFIVNEAFLSKLCILGEECEPCFEGS